MKTLEIEIAIMKYLNIRQNLVVPNVFWGMGLRYECDLVKLSKNNYATEIEIKVSKSDLLKDREKRNYHNSRLFKYLYFAVPSELKEIALQEIPEKSGLFIVTSRHNQLHVNEIRKPVKRVCKQWTEQQRYNLARLGALRILGLKQKLLKKERQNGTL